MAVSKTFYGRALTQFQHQANGAYRRGMIWYGNARHHVHGANKRIVNWVAKHRRGIILSIGFLVCIAITALFISDLASGRIANAQQVGIGGLIGAPILGLMIGIIVAVLMYLSLWLIDRLLLGFIYLLLLVPIIIGALFYAVYLLLAVASQFVLLAPLSVLVFFNGLWLIWRHIFYTCPNRECTHRGLPVYLCPTCTMEQPRLWPNLYGLLHHPCTQCGRKLPTLDILGRNRLMRLCGMCGTELVVMTLPEELVALAGAANVGKTVYLLTSIQALQEEMSDKAIHAEIPVPRQKKELELLIGNLKQGIPPAKTDATLKHAYLLHLRRKERETLLYYYDAAGEQFSSIDQYGRHENVKHLNGLILLIDPFSLGELRAEARKLGEGVQASTTSLDEVVAAIINTLHRMHGRRGLPTPMPLAVVITKADTAPVQKTLGDLTRALPTSEQCEQALVKWGAENSLRLLRQNFKSVRYFACSALGRSPAVGDNRPFQSCGVLDALLWILKT